MIEAFLFVFASSMQARDKDGCPNPNTLAGQILFEEGATCPKWEAEERAKKQRELATIAKHLKVKGTQLPSDSQSAIKSELSKQLLDGFSAQYLWPARQHAYLYCGFVNSKNRFGAYTGWRQFAAIFNDTDKLAGVVTIEDDRKNDEFARACDDSKYPVSPVEM